MFCSTNCQDNANEIYHNYECIINNVIPGVKDVVYAMRPFFCALYFFNKNIEELKSFVLSRNNEKKTIFDCDISESSSLNWLHVFDSIDAPAVTDLSSILPSVFNAHPVLIDMWPTHQDFLLPYLNRHADILRFISRDVYQWPGNAEPLMKYHVQKKAVDLIRLQKIVGKVSCLFSPLLSQSCKPNIYRHNYQSNEMYYIVAHNINVGEKLTICNK